MEETDDASYTTVWESKRIDNTLSPVWAETKLSLDTICNCDLDRPLKIEIWDYNESQNHSFMGEVQASVNEMLRAKGEPFPIIEPLKAMNNANRSSGIFKLPGSGSAYQNSGLLNICNPRIEKNYSFVDVSAYSMHM